jgi:hypothetical protein
VLKIPRGSLAPFVVGNHPPDILSWPSCVDYFSQANSHTVRRANGHARRNLDDKGSRHGHLDCD